ncbi:MAG: FG-GAP-like repeat-containing protein [Thermoleophilia bacterium]
MIALLMCAGAAEATLPQQQGLLNLTSNQGGAVDLQGAGAGDRAGETVAGLGDFDGDGSRDVAVGAWRADPRGRVDAGTVFVAFGPFTGPSIDLGSSPNVMRIDGAIAGDWVGVGVASAGDVNGDGRPDLLVGANQTDNNGRINSGSVYLIWGSADRSSVDLGNLGGRGIRIDGAAAGDELGASSVAGVGDINGDGYPDIAVGARGADNNNRANSGSAYVVFGGPHMDNVDLANPQGRAVRIDGANTADQLGTRVAAAGDFNGDGRPDLMVSAPTFDPGGAAGGRLDAGAVYVVFGSAGFGSLDLGGPEATTRSVRIDGAVAGDQTGTAIAPIGDTNGDGRSEVMIGAPYAESGGRADAGAAFMVRGAADTAPVDLSNLGARSVRVDGAQAGDFLGVTLASVGDLNGDGRGDLMLGANGLDTSTATNMGGAYLVTSLPQAGRLDLAQPGGAAITVLGSGPGDQSGSSVAALGDVTGDGRPDALVGSRFADPLGRVDAGAAQVVLGFGQPEVAYTADALQGRVGTPIAARGPSAIQRTGAAQFTVSPALPAGVTIDHGTGVISGTPTAAAEARAYTVTMSDLAGTGTASVSLGVSAGGIVQKGGRTVTLRSFSTRCVRVRVSGPCRVQVRFRASAATRLIVELRSLRPNRRIGGVRVTVHAGLNRVLLPARFGRRAVSPGRYVVRLRRVSAPLAVRPSAVGVRVTLRGGATR